MLFLRQAKDNGWLVIVGNNGRLINPAKPEIADFYFERPNKNRDLGVYAEAVRRYPQFQSEIIFTNSSLRWSKNSLKNIYAEIEKRNEFEVLFMTESLQPIRHGQTFFIWFSKESVLSGTHKKIMNPRRNWGSKRLLVWSEELTMLQRIEKLNNTVGFLLRYSQLTRQFKSEDKVKDLYDLSDFKSISERVEKNIPLNPSIHFSPLVFQRFGIHKSSLFANPAQMKSPLHFLQSGKNS
jgi:hypothetical protein